MNMRNLKCHRSIEARMQRLGVILYSHSASHSSLAAAGPHCRQMQVVTISANGE